jgi:RNA polymerase sigma factor (sigma-70 family)
MDAPSDALSPALEAAITRYADLVRQVSRQHGLAGADVDDVMQAVRIRLWKALQQGERITQVKPFYVRRAAMSAALDLIRARRAGREEPIMESTRPADQLRMANSPTPADELEQAEIEERVGRAIDSLNETRQPVVRMYLAGYNSEEIAQVFGWTEAKARNLLYRGLADLRNLLTQWGMAPGALT